MHQLTTLTLAPAAQPMQRLAEDLVRPHRSDRVRWLNGPRF
jgi:hypothetical protein